MQKKVAPKKLNVLNKKAGFDIAVEKTYEAGLVLKGDEIKSIRAERVQLTGSYLRFIQNKFVVIGTHLGLAKDPERTREVLLHQNEIEEIKKSIEAKGKVAVPLKMYFKKGWAKLEIGIGRGRKTHDKRELLKDRAVKKEQAGELKRFTRS